MLPPPDWDKEANRLLAEAMALPPGPALAALYDAWLRTGNNPALRDALVRAIIGEAVALRQVTQMKTSPSHKVPLP